MPKTARPLTATQVANAKPKQKKYKIADGGGLSLCVYPTGNKAWLLRVKINQKYRELYQPLETHSLAQARAWRESTKQQIRDGTFIEEEKTKAPTFRLIFSEWSKKWADDVSEKYSKQLISAVNNNVMPNLGGMLVDEIRPVHIVESLKTMEERGALEYLKRTKTGIKLALDYAVARGLIDINPALAVTPKAFKRHTPTNFRALTPDELPTLIKTIEQGLATNKIRPLTYYLIYWQLLTLTRPAEAAGAMWSEIDEVKQLWIIPAKRMKANREHIIPLTDTSMSIIKTLEEANLMGVYLFEGRAGHMNRETVRMALNRLNINSTAHGFRSLARSFLGESGKFRREALELCLAHNIGSKTEQAYDRALYLEERRAIMDYWGNEIQRLRQEYKGF